MALIGKCTMERHVGCACHLPFLNRCRLCQQLVFFSSVPSISIFWYCQASRALGDCKKLLTWFHSGWPTKRLLSNATVYLWRPHQICYSSDLLLNCLLKTWRGEGGREGKLIWKLEPFFFSVFSRTHFLTWISVSGSITQAWLQVFLLHHNGAEETCLLQPTPVG